MKQIKNATYPLLCAGLFLSGCNFSEECHYTGNVNVTTDWSQLIPKDSIPMTEASFYVATGGVQRYEISKDTLLTGVSAGEQTALLVSRAAGVQFTGMESAGTAQAQLPTYTEEGITYTVQAPLLYADCQRLKVEPFETTTCRFVPTPCIRQVNFTFHIIREADAGEPLVLDGRLSGLDSRFNLAAHEAAGGRATLKFSTMKVAVDDFKQTIRVFGFCQTKKVPQFPTNLLTLRVQLSDGYQHEATIPMDKLLASVTAPVINCKIDVFISSLGASLVVSGWEVGNWGEIELS